MNNLARNEFDESSAYNQINNDTVDPRTTTKKSRFWTLAARHHEVKGDEERRPTAELPTNREITGGFAAYNATSSNK